ncbi:glycosyltransferase [Leptospira interrogans]
MGGLAAFTRHTFETLRGFDERMLVWGAEDQDFAMRAARFGLTRNWISRAGCEIYHLWHPPSLQAPGAKEHFDRNRTLMRESNGIIRNLVAPQCFRASTPLVSIVIATRNRSQYLRSCLKSCLAQTFEDFEIVVIDDGSTDDTEGVVRELSHSKIQYHRLDKPGGVAKARNVGTRLATGHFVVIQDDDDLMLPGRLELQLSSITSGIAGSYGGWIDFDENEPSLAFWCGKSPASLDAILFNSRVLLHPTLMLRREVMLAYPYNEEFLGGSDFNLVARMVQDGVTLVHAGDFLILRRLHSNSLTAAASDRQKIASKVTTSTFIQAMTSKEEDEARRRGRAVGVHSFSGNSVERSLLRLLPAPMRVHRTRIDFRPTILDHLLSRDNVRFSVQYEVRNGRLHFSTIELDSEPSALGLPRDSNGERSDELLQPVERLRIDTDHAEGGDWFRRALLRTPLSSTPTEMSNESYLIASGSAVDPKMIVGLEIYADDGERGRILFESAERALRWQPDHTNDGRAIFAVRSKHIERSLLTRTKGLAATALPTTLLSYMPGR